MSRKNVIRGRFRLYPGQDDDLITWWKSLNDLPYGGKGQAIKEVLRKELDISEHGSTPCQRQPCGQAGLRPGAGELGGSIPAQDNLLLDIRRVVEAAVTEVLNQGHVEVRRESETSAENRDPEDTARVDELMAEMQRNLLLPEDEDDL